LGREAAHSRHRIVHAQGDQTGAEIARALRERVDENPNIEVREFARVLDLIVHDGQCAGVRASIAGQPVDILADATVLATGGCGQVFRYTTNPQVATGDGFAIAHRAGVRLADMEFVQFHPTALATSENPLSLISEAVRGEGAVLLNAAGERFMMRRHRLAELAPRDVVAREIFKEQQKSGTVSLDARHMGRRFATRFPGITAICKARGIAPARHLIPVTPAAHYMMGGIVTDLRGRSSLPRLYAVGEVARTGVHGANRLASNSLLEGLVFARRAASAVAAKRYEGPLADPPLWDVGTATPSDEAVLVSQNWDEIRRTMWNYVGIVRSDKRLRRASRRIALLQEEIREYYWRHLVTRDLLELRNLADVAEMIVASAAFRKESRGLHYTIDHPHTDEAWAADTVLVRGESPRLVRWAGRSVRR
jgi:L-aspartate oxidase